MVDCLLTRLQPLLISGLPFQVWMCTDRKPHVFVMVYVLKMVDEAWPFCLHNVWIAIRCGGCSPVKMVYDGRYPKAEILTASLLGGWIQSLLQTCSDKHNITKQKLFKQGSGTYINIYKETYIIRGTPILSWKCFICIMWTCHACRPCWSTSGHRSK